MVDRRTNGHVITKLSLIIGIVYSRVGSSELFFDPRRQPFIIPNAKHF